MSFLCGGGRLLVLAALISLEVRGWESDIGRLIGLSREFDEVKYRTGGFCLRVQAPVAHQTGIYVDLFVPSLLSITWLRLKVALKLAPVHMTLLAFGK